ncbi:hypothetical protein [Flavobacterium psychrophilum]|uniref:hypothetical protein n=1 Tax=Flavobacterium psychrophilum TaxID=96345 RepID=UPI000B7C561B|nr:hypothetical protein [Flavobacterium psychrophilum]MCB6099607.1 hypothetical protein [Flavobacterium psychrophilum]SNA87762.1 conserved hypothetical protein [Flavobacterium psychrophilum]
MKTFIKKIQNLFSRNKVECDNHGLRNPAFVCQHLNLEFKVGFNEPYLEVNSKEKDLNAWCDECEKVRVLEGEWNDISEGYAKIKLVCDKCFFEMKKLNN